MNKLAVTRPDQRVNLGSRRDGTVEVTVRVTLTAAEAELVGGADRATGFVTDWLSPSLSAFGVWLGEQAVRDDCRICGGRLVGTELGYGTCGQCGGRAVSA